MNTNIIAKVNTGVYNLDELENFLDKKLVCSSNSQNMNELISVLNLIYDRIDISRNMLFNMGLRSKQESYGNSNFTDKETIKHIMSFFESCNKRFGTQNNKKKKMLELKQKIKFQVLSVGLNHLGKEETIRQLTSNKFMINNLPKGNNKNKKNFLSNHTKRAKIINSRQNKSFNYNINKLGKKLYNYSKNTRKQNLKQRMKLNKFNRIPYVPYNN